jgi:hypothetical protein
LTESAQEMFDMLCHPFPLEFVEWRVGSTNQEKTHGLALCYIDARTVMDRLDTICGPAGWQCHYTMAANLAICNIGLLVGSEWIWKADGAGATDVEGEKGMLSDALKRAAVRWGVGRYLYDMKSPWVELEPIGRSYKIKDSEKKKLDDVHEEFCARAGWGPKEGVQSYRVLSHTVKTMVKTADDKAVFLENTKGMLPKLPVAMRKHLTETLDRIGA